MTEITGYIKDKNSKEPLIGAHVILEDQYNGDMVSGTVTDATGFFSIEKRPATIAKVSYIGYRTSYPLLYTGLARDYFLDVSENLLDEAVIVGSVEKNTFDYKAIVLIVVFILITFYLIYNKL